MIETIEIERGIYAAVTHNTTANAGFVTTARGPIVVDTLSSPAHGETLSLAVAALTGRPPFLVVNTHHHPNHVFGNQAFDAPVVAHAALASELARTAARDLSPLALAARLSQHPEDRWLADELELVYPSVTFEARLTLDLTPRHVVLQHVGGHTPDMTVVDLPKEGVLFASDILFEGRVPFLRDANIGQTIEALRWIEALGDRTIVPGHGAVCDRAYATRTRRYLEGLREKVAALMAKGWEKADILDSPELPSWWTEDRPELVRINVERVYDELALGG